MKKIYKNLIPVIPILILSFVAILVAYLLFYNNHILGEFSRIVELYSSTMAIALALGILYAAIVSKNNRARLTLDLEQALGDIHKSNHIKSEFLAKMSHEMRTQLNVVIGLSEQTMESGGLDNGGYGNLEKVYNAGTSLLSTVNDILDISKIESGKLEIVPIDYELPNLIKDTIVQSMTHLDDKPVEFVLNIDGNVPHRLLGDEPRIKQIIYNILSNSFKYTREGIVELYLSCTVEGGYAWLAINVRDSGIGIRPEDMDSLFIEYVKMDPARRGNIMGTGLGLPIAKKLTEMMGGTIEVSSLYGEGSEFNVKIRQKIIDEETISPETINSLKDLNRNRKICKTTPRQRIKLPYARVLVVDDNAINFNVVKVLLKPYEMKIDCVTDGYQAIQAIRDEKVIYNAIFMDHMMPDMDGIETTRIIREEIGTDYAREIPIIALTANTIKGNKDTFLNNGFQSYVSKPINTKTLDDVLCMWVRDEEAEKRHDELYDSTERRILSDRRSGVDRRDARDMEMRLNFNEGVKRFGGDENAFLQVLRSFMENIGPILDSVKKVDESNLSEYAIRVHGIKASCRGIYAAYAGDRAQTLEKAAKAGNYKYVAIHNTAFVEAVEILVEDINYLLEEYKKHNPKPKKDKPDREILRKLLAACENNDMDGADEAMAEIDGFEYKYGIKLVAWLRKNVSQMNFDEIVGKLSIMSNHTNIDNGSVFNEKVS